MLKTARIKLTDPAMTAVLRCINNGLSEQTLQEGLIKIGHFSPEYSHCVSDNWDCEGVDGELYGVADTPEQVFQYAQRVVGDDSRAFCVFVTHVAKHSENRGCGGGWRWHKWGEYIGTGTPECEYLDDEEGFNDGVYVFGIHPLL